MYCENGTSQEREERGRTERRQKDRDQRGVRAVKRHVERMKGNGASRSHAPVERVRQRRHRPIRGSPRWHRSPVGGSEDFSGIGQAVDRRVPDDVTVVVVSEAVAEGGEVDDERQPHGHCSGAPRRHANLTYRMLPSVVPLRASRQVIRLRMSPVRSRDSWDPHLGSSIIVEGHKRGNHFGWGTPCEDPDTREETYPVRPSFAAYIQRRFGFTSIEPSATLWRLCS